MAMAFRGDSRRINERKLGVAGKISLLVLVLVASSMAQDRLEGPPPAAGVGPTYDVSVGYSYLSSSVPATGRVNLQGLEATSHLDFLPHWGLALDAGYVRTADVLSTGHTGYVLTFLGGPVFYPFDRTRTKIFFHGLVGAGMVDSAVPQSNNSYVYGWVDRPAYAIGGGVERSFFGPFGLRFSGDYLRTAFADANENIRMQNNLRVTASFVFRLNQPRHGE